MKNFKSSLSLLLTVTAAAFLFSSSASAGITVYPIAVGMNEGNSSQIKVFTNSDKTEFVRTTIKKINNPGSKQENESSVSQASGNMLVVTPEKFALSPGATRIIRLVNLVPPVNEEVYRVYFENVSSLDDSAAPANNEVQVGVNMIWGVLVNVAPARPHVDFTLNASAREVNNTGNIHLKISSIGLCPKSGTDAGCKWSKGVKKSVYPGQTMILPAEYFSGMNYQTVRVKYINWVDKTAAEKEFISSRP